MKLKEFEHMFRKRLSYSQKDMLHNIFVLGVFCGTYYASKGHEQQMADAIDELKEFGLNQEEICELLDRIDSIRDDIKLYATRLR